MLGSLDLLRPDSGTCCLQSAEMFHDGNRNMFWVSEVLRVMVGSLLIASLMSS